MIIWCLIVFFIILYVKTWIHFQNMRTILQYRCSMRQLSSFFLVALLFSACKSPRPVVVPRAEVVMPDHSVVVQPVSSTVNVPVVEQPKTVDALPQVTPSKSDWADVKRAELEALCHDSLSMTTQIGLYVYDLTQESILFAHNEQQRFRPASCQKVITSVSALALLGTDYCFRTSLLTDGAVSGGVLQGDVYVVGGMDPLLSRADVRKLVTALKEKGIRQVKGHFYQDLSFREEAQYGWGWCWDDDYGPLSALMVDGKDQFENQWMDMIHNQGIICLDKSCKMRVCPATATLVSTITHSLDEVLPTMMKQSDNIYAECLFYQIAASGGEKQAGRKQVQELVSPLIANMGIAPASYMIADGSGLSLYNYVTPVLLTSFLKYAWKNENIMTHFLPSLPVAGVDGTLKNRMKNTSAFRKVQAKTGSLYGLSSLCGFAKTANGHTVAFTIINQGVSKCDDGRDFQDRVCDILCK